MPQKADFENEASRDRPDVSIKLSGNPPFAAFMGPVGMLRPFHPHSRERPPRGAKANAWFEAQIVWPIS